MRRVVVLLMSVGLLALAGLFAAPTVSAGDPCYHGFTIPPRTSAGETQIKVAPCAFAPTVTTVAAGSTVTFFNGPDYTHLITGANAEWGSRDVELKPNAEVSYTFDKPGIYPYACALHRGMSGTIVVGDLASAGGTTTGGTTAGGNGPVTSDAALAAATKPAASGPDPIGIAAGAGAGILVGAAAAWLAMRRRTRAGAVGQPLPGPDLT